MVELEKLMTLGKVAVKIGVLDDQLRRLCDRNEIPYRRFMGKRLLHADDLDTIRAACIKRGYITPAEAAHDAAV